MTLAACRLLTVFVAAAVACRAAISPSEIAEKSAKGLMLIDLNEGVDPAWMTEEQKLKLIRADIGFVSVCSIDHLCGY